MLRECKENVSIAIPIATKENGNNGQAKINLHEVAERCMKQANGNVVQASQYLREMMKNDTELRYAILAPFEVKASYEVIANYARRERVYIWRAPNDDGQGRPDRVHALVKANVDIIMEMTLPIRGLPKLGDCTKEQVLEAISWYRGHIEDMTGKMQFLEAVTSLMKSTDKANTVRQLIKSVELYKLHQQFAPRLDA